MLSTDIINCKLLEKSIAKTLHLYPIPQDSHKLSFNNKEALPFLVKHINPFKPILKLVPQNFTIQLNLAA